VTLVIDPARVLARHGEAVTAGAVDLLEQAALVAATNQGALFTPDADRVAGCPYCSRGGVTGPNGEAWRCAFCHGTRRIITPRRKEALR
jgi:hypothetical protein